MNNHYKAKVCKPENKGIIIYQRNRF